MFSTSSVTGQIDDNSRLRPRSNIQVPSMTPKQFDCVAFLTMVKVKFGWRYIEIEPIGLQYCAMCIRSKEQSLPNRRKKTRRTLIIATKHFQLSEQPIIGFSETLKSFWSLERFRIKGNRQATTTRSTRVKEHPGKDACLRILRPNSLTPCCCMRRLAAWL